MNEHLSTDRAAYRIMTSGPDPDRPARVSYDCHTIIMSVGTNGMNALFLPTFTAIDSVLMNAYRAQR